MQAMITHLKCILMSKSHITLHIPDSKTAGPAVHTMRSVEQHTESHFNRLLLGQPVEEAYRDTTPCLYVHLK